MDRDSVDWQGYLAAFVTPFHRDGALDLETLEALVDHYVGEGLHGIVVNGTCGEWFSQSETERREVAEAAVARAAGRFRVIVGCTSYTADQVAGLATDALEAGADGVLVSPPPYVKLFAPEVVAFYEDVSARVNGPIAVYNWPYGSGIDIDPELADRLADVENVVAIKDSTASIDQFFATSRRVRDRVRVFGPYLSERGLEELRESGVTAPWAAARCSDGTTRSSGSTSGRATWSAHTRTRSDRTGSSRGCGCRADGRAGSVPTRASSRR